MVLEHLPEWVATPIDLKVEESDLAGDPLPLSHDLSILLSRRWMFSYSRLLSLS